jgi:hypothetical protein
MMWPISRPACGKPTSNLWKAAVLGYSKIADKKKTDKASYFKDGK